jgi:hypothetical protein
VASNACVLELHQKSVTKEGWPVLQVRARAGALGVGGTAALHV